MKNKDKENIANLYLEIAYNDPTERLILTKAFSEHLLDKKFPFWFTGIIDGEKEDLTVDNVPIKDYQIKHIVNSFVNDSLGCAYDPKYEEFADKTTKHIIADVSEKLNIYRKIKNSTSSSPSPKDKNSGRWNPGDDFEGGVL